MRALGLAAATVMAMAGSLAEPRGHFNTGQAASKGARDRQRSGFEPTAHDLERQRLAEMKRKRRAAKHKSCK